MKKWKSKAHVGAVMVTSATGQEAAYQKAKQSKEFEHPETEVQEKVMSLGIYRYQMSCNKRMMGFVKRMDEMTKEEEKVSAEFLDSASVCKDDVHEDECSLFTEYGKAHKTIAAARKELIATYNTVTTEWKAVDKRISEMTTLEDKLNRALTDWQYFDKAKKASSIPAGEPATSEEKYSRVSEEFIEAMEEFEGEMGNKYEEW
eukprot:TRINITY_DN1299_c0_g1_i2.p1 TRINITY_DN1299_c0_g1~~TRINITY_DN1299_c0_g1_i2.p1  ORF type:complete len:203 (-),score=53.92 TRINITY_DN1299_c0_g1_i2:393-1001(-)